jgi:hypothetical protein
MKHFFAYNLKSGRGIGIYIDFEIKSYSKENIAVSSFLTLHTTRKTKEAFPLILNNKQ